MRVIRAHRKAPKHLLPERLGGMKSLLLGARRLIGEKKVGGGKREEGEKIGEAAVERPKLGACQPARGLTGKAHLCLPPLEMAAVEAD